jgi:bifunctional DNA-binding transcriptional regulator/antitoxin component of YhaV-PrlF toxin-antitoxin module
MEAKFVGKAKLTKQGQLTLPQEARKDLKIDVKSEVYWYEFNNILILVKDLVNPREIMDLILSKKKGNKK